MNKPTDLEWILALGVSAENVAIRIGRSPAVVKVELETAADDDEDEDTP